MPPYTPVHLVILAVLCLAAAAWDLARRRIPNAIVAAVLVSGLCLQAAIGGGWAALTGAGAGAIVLFALYPLWTRGGIGGGDVKFAVAAAAWVGLPRLAAFMLASALAGGVVAAACYLLSRHDARREIRGNLWLALLVREIPDAGATRRGPGRVSVPYALAISGGVFAALLGDWPPPF